MRVIIAGSRGFNDYERVKRELLPVHGFLTEIVSGCAPGADRLGERYACEHGLLVKCFRPKWDELGRAAGPVRNFEMASYADRAIVFWDGVSPGTRSLIAEMEKLKKPVLIIKF
jgi:hypothetical protein